METILTDLSSGNITIYTGIVGCAVAAILGIIGGFGGGVIIGGKDLGIGLAGMMGSFFGALIAVPAAFISQALLYFIS